jgi:hypothetical protein
MTKHICKKTEAQSTEKKKKNRNTTTRYDGVGKKIDDYMKYLKQYLYEFGWGTESYPSFCQTHVCLFWVQECPSFANRIHNDLLALNCDHTQNVARAQFHKSSACVTVPKTLTSNTKILLSRCPGTTLNHNYNVCCHHDPALLLVMTC